MPEIIQYKKIFLKENAAASIKNGHPWCFRGSIERMEEIVENGELCELFYRNTFLAVAYYNSGPELAIRILSRTKLIIDTDYLIKKFKALKNHKEEFLEDTNAYRLINAESDGFPGLIADCYNGVIVIQIQTMGMEKLKQMTVNALIGVFKPKMIYEKSSSGIRLNEGLPRENNQLLFGKLREKIEIMENGRLFLVNIVEGQKTGFFLDQRNNRLSIVRYCRGKKVLNCFSYTGGFSVYAAGVAESVTSVDLSRPAIEDAITNFKLNGLDTLRNQFLALDVFDYLKTIEKGQYDVIILDPPSFARNKEQIPNALKAYTTINSKALEKLENYGILVSSSCSSHIDEAAYIKMLHQSAVSTNCVIKILESGIQPHDHAVNPGYPEGRYLKFFVLQKWPVN